MSTKYTLLPQDDIGLNFPDALLGSVIVAAGNHPIVLVVNDHDLSTIK